jgi:hypothetical protein
MQNYQRNLVPIPDTPPPSPRPASLGRGLRCLARLPTGSTPRPESNPPERTGELRKAVIGFLASAPPGLLVVIQQDLKKRQRQRPCSHPNSAIR